MARSVPDFKKLTWLLVKKNCSKYKWMKNEAPSYSSIFSKKKEGKAGLFPKVSTSLSLWVIWWLNWAIIALIFYLTWCCVHITSPGYP